MWKKTLAIGLGIWTLASTAFAEQPKIQEYRNILNSGKYYVQELISPNEFGQYSNVSVDGSSETTNYDVTVGGDTFKGYKSPVKDVSDGSTIFHFNNKVDFAKLGSLSISKNLIENVGNHKDDYFKF